jgi:hypothetical protein
MAMDFVARENIRRLKARLASEADSQARATIESLLKKEEEKLARLTRPFRKESGQA